AAPSAVVAVRMVRRSKASLRMSSIRLWSLPIVRGVAVSCSITVSRLHQRLPGSRLFGSSNSNRWNELSFYTALVAATSSRPMTITTVCFIEPTGSKGLQGGHCKRAVSNDNATFHVAIECRAKSSMNHSRFHGGVQFHFIKSWLATIVSLVVGDAVD